jgi:hypothetical protein
MISAGGTFEVIDESVYFLVWCSPVKLALRVLDVAVK